MTVGKVEREVVKKLKSEAAHLHLLYPPHNTRPIIQNQNHHHHQQQQHQEQEEQEEQIKKKEEMADPASLAAAGGIYSELIPLAKDINAGDISIGLKGRVLTVEVKTEERSKDGTPNGRFKYEFGKMFTLPNNVDVTQLTSALTEDGSLRVEAPYIGKGPGGGASNPLPTSSTSSIPAPSNTKGANPGMSPRQSVDLTSTILNLAEELHNQLRANHGVPGLKIDQKLCGKAEVYAESVVNGKKPKDDSSLGRNTFQVKTSGPTGMNHVEAVRQAVTSWYSHVREYNWRQPLSSPSHAKLFSQLVWKSSKTLGLGVVSKSGPSGTHTCVCCVYSPAGNLVSERKYKENVLRASS